MRSSSGGWVSNIRLSFDIFPSSGVRARGDSIQRWAVARDALWTTVWSAWSFSRAEINPGG